MNTSIQFKSNAKIEIHDSHINVIINMWVDKP
jgi:hypothetical protein